jgi:transforming growth factor-beta-induced protein
MKTKKLTLVLFALLGIFILSGCEKEDEFPQPAQIIVQLARAQPNLSSLVTALTKFPDLVATLSGRGKFTVFAPTNDASAALLGAIG